MARGRAPTPRSANLTTDKMRAAIPRLEARVKELRELELGSIKSGADPAVQGIEARIKSTLSSIYGEDTREFERLRVAGDLDMTMYSLVLGDGRPTPVEEIREGVGEGRQRAIATLQGEVDSLKEAIGSEDNLAAAPVAKREVPSNDVFVVHGHDSPAKIEVARFIERAGLNASFSTNSRMLAGRLSRSSRITADHLASPSSL